MSPRCTPIGAATSPSTRASATAGLVTPSTSIKEIHEVEMIQVAFYSLNPEREARVLSDAGSIDNWERGEATTGSPSSIWAVEVRR